MPKGKIGFEQLNENLKQKIELGGSGGGGGVGFLKNTVEVTTSTSTVKIGLNFKPGTDALLVFKNSTYQELEHDYTIDESGKYIKTVSGQWIASTEAPVTFNFIILRTVPLANSIASNTGAVGFIRKTILVEEDTNEIELDLMYNKVTDAILVFRNSVLIEAEEDYTIDMDRQVLINPNANWCAGTLLNLMVFKSVPVEDVKFDGAIIEDGTITIDKLSPEFNLLINNLVKDFETSMSQINENIKNLENTMNNTINNNMTNMQNSINDMQILLDSKQSKNDNSLKTSSKNVVGAINEVFQYANDGKSTIANAIVGKGGNANTAMTFAQLATSIKNLSTRKDAFADLSLLFRFDESTTKPQIDYVLSQCQVNVWNRLGSSISTRKNFGDAIIRNRYYILGGEEDNSEYSSVKYFDMATETFSTSTSLPQETAYTNVAKTPVGTFLLGVYKYNSKGDSQYSSACYQWNTNDTFSSIPSIPQIYDDVGIVDSGSKLYLAGGIKYGGGTNNYWYYYQTLYAFDYTTRTWTTLIDQGSMRDDKSVINRGNAVYYKDGKLYNSSGRCEVDLSTNKWDESTLAGIPNVTIPSTFLPVRTAAKVNDDKKQFYKSGNNVLIKDFNTGLVTKQSKFSGATPTTSLEALLGNNNFIYAIDRIRDTSKNYYLNALKLDRNFDNYLAQ